MFTIKIRTSVIASLIEKYIASCMTVNNIQHYNDEFCDDARIRVIYCLDDGETEFIYKNHKIVYVKSSRISAAENVSVSLLQIHDCETKKSAMNIYENMLQDAYMYSTMNTAGYVRVTMALNNNETSSISTINKVELSDIIINDEQRQKLISSIQTFYNSIEIYNQLGYPHVKKYLIHGNLVKDYSGVALGLASYFDKQVFRLDLSLFNKSLLAKFFMLMNHNCNSRNNYIIVFEGVIPAIKNDTIKLIDEYCKYYNKVHNMIILYPIIEDNKIDLNEISSHVDEICQLSYDKNDLLNIISKYFTLTPLLIEKITNIIDLSSVSPDMIKKFIVNNRHSDDIIESLESFLKKNSCSSKSLSYFM